MATLVAPPIPIFTDSDGSPLENGKIYIGTQFLNAETSPQQTFWDSALTIPATQPIRTRGGYPWYGGSPALIYVASDYSISVRNKNDVQIMSNLNAATLTPSALLAMIKTVDGTGSGLDADLLDGFHAADITDPLTNMITEAGLTYDATDKYQFSKAVIALGTPLGANIFTDTRLTQVAYPNAKSTANPGNPQYLPIISRAVDKTITTAMSLPLVTLYRAHTASVLGSTTFVGTVAASTITFSITATNTAMLQMVLNEALVRRWFSSSQSATFAGSGGDFTGMTVNVAGTDFAITAINVGAGTMTVTGTPTAGAQNCILYPYRVLGSSTSIQLPRLSGFVLTGDGDDDGLFVNGYRSMDFMQGHFHDWSVFKTGAAAGAWSAAGGNATMTLDNTGVIVGSPRSDGTNGTPRTGKNMTPRSISRNIYTWAQVLNAAA